MPSPKKTHLEAFDIFPCFMMEFLCYSCTHTAKKLVTDQETAKSSSTEGSTNYP